MAMMMTLLSLAVLAAAASAGKRVGVIQYGSTMPASWVPPKSQLVKCPNDFTAFNNGTLCCPRVFRLAAAPGCPTTDVPYLRFGDPPSCCPTANTTVCPNLKRRCSTRKLGYSCPANYPFTLSYGTSCCSNLQRAPICDPLGTNSSLQFKDPNNCCLGNMLIACPTSTGNQGFCQPYKCNIASPSINYTDPWLYGTPLFATTGVLTSECEESTAAIAGWVWDAPFGAVNVVFIVDMGCPRMVRTVMLRNTHSFEYNNMAMKDFRIDLSLDQSSWTPVANGTLASVVGMSCLTSPPTPLVEFQASTLVMAKFLRFTALSYYNDGCLGAGLEYITWTAY